MHTIHTRNQRVSMWRNQRSRPKDGAASVNCRNYSMLNHCEGLSHELELLEEIAVLGLVARDGCQAGRVVLRLLYPQLVQQ